MPSLASLRSTAAGPRNAWLISCDGSALPNRGRIGIGAVLVAPDGARHTISQERGRGCNNEAEALALIAALSLALVLGARDLAIQCDSDVTVQEVAGSKRTRIARLASLFENARALVARFDHVALTLVPRRKNADADVLARAALGLAAKP